MNQNANRQRQYTERQYADRRYAEHPYEDRRYEYADRQYAGRPYEDRQYQYAERPYDDRRYEYVDRPYAERPYADRQYAGRPYQYENRQYAGRQYAGRTNPRRGKGGIVALVLAVVLAIGGVGAFCMAGLGKSHIQAPVATQTTTSAPSQASTQPAQQQSNQAPATQDSQPGMEVKVSREGAIAMACDHVGANGQAQNVKTSDLITGGGTKYYIVDFDMDGTHYTVNVDVVDGHVISAEKAESGTRQLLDENGNPEEGTQQPVDA